MFTLNDLTERIMWHDEYAMRSKQGDGSEACIRAADELVKAWRQRQPKP